MSYEGPIDMSRPLMYCSHPQGMRIFMYLDDPGAYLDGHGRHVPADLAKEAGFPVERYARQRKAKLEMDKAKEMISQQFSIGAEKEVYAEEAGYRVVHFPETGMAVLESEGVSYTPTPIPLSMAVTMFKSFVADAKGAKREEGSGAEQGQAQSPKAAPTPPTPSAEVAEKAQSGKKGAAAMLK